MTPAGAPPGTMPVTVVVPTVGRPSVRALLRSVADSRGPLPERVVVVHDRPGAGAARLDGPPPERLADRLTLLRGRARGPAAARNAGWRVAASEWVAFLDDDVLVERDWLARLAADLSAAGPLVAGVQGRITVPLPHGRRPTDWERNVARLEAARWATADLAYRRDVLVLAGGFDERFPRAYREDADLALRVLAHGFTIVPGGRGVLHPVRPADRWVSVRLQAGNADDALMLALHGRGWRRRAGVPRGRRPLHVAITAAGVAAGLALARGRRSAAACAAAVWLGATAELAWSRARPGPRTAGEITTLALTSAAIPAAATWHWLRGLTGVALLPLAPARRRARLPAAVLFDRDGTLVHDCPYNGEPARVRPVATAAEAVQRLRFAGVRTAVVSNQGGVGHGLLDETGLRAVNRRVEELLGPLGPWLHCPHTAEDGCGCRKPAPGLVTRAAALLGVATSACVVVGDVGSDVAAARAAGARAVLVPTAATRPEEVAAAPCVARDLAEAVDVILAGAV